MIQRIFYDFEFNEDGKTIEPISLGMVKDHASGQVQELYIEFDFDEARVRRENKWVHEYVVPLLQWPKRMRMSRAQARTCVLNFTGDAHTGPQIELWAFFADYDHIALCQLFGKMNDLPGNYPWLTLDIQQEYLRLGRPEGVKPTAPAEQHNALADARWNFEFWKRLRAYEQNTP